MLEYWNRCFANKDWSTIEDRANVQDKVTEFTTLISEALDELAPVKSFTIKSNYKFGLSDKVKDLMKERNKVRNNLKSASINEKKVLLQKYKALRNKVTSTIGKENLDDEILEWKSAE